MMYSRIRNLKNFPQKILQRKRRYLISEMMQGAVSKGKNASTYDRFNCVLAEFFPSLLVFDSKDDNVQNIICY